MRICPSCSREKVDDSGRCTNTKCTVYCRRVLDELETICEECGGSGLMMKMVCYGGLPSEVTEPCDACNGDGVIETN